MARRADIVAEARRWIGTPFRHQGRVLGVGVDCAGLVIGVAHALGLSSFDYTQYGREPANGLLLDICERHLNRMPLLDARPGDIYAMRFGAEPQHLAIVSDYGIIHAYAPAGKCVEHRMDDVWRRRIVRAYRYRGVE